MSDPQLDRVDPTVVVLLESLRLDHGPAFGQAYHSQASVEIDSDLGMKIARRAASGRKLPAEYLRERSEDLS